MKRLSFAVLSLVAFLSFSFSASSQVVISEFMADNTRVLFDEDGDSEDWIEIHNTGINVVNLLDWALTDSAGDLTKWRFPATNLNVGAYMVIFASNKDRRTPGRPLHTNFRLDPDGEFLALVKPDGTNITSRFTPFYPLQVPNVSFGFGLVTSNTTLVATGAAVRVLVPAVANGGTMLGDVWKGGSEPFPDGGWISGVTGVGFSLGVSSLVATSALTVRLNFDAAPVGNVIVDSKPTGAPINGANNNAFWTASSTDNSPKPISRSGLMQFIAPTNSQVTLPANAAFNATRGTISFWMRSGGWFGPGQGPAVVFDRRVGQSQPTAILANGAVLIQSDDGRLQFLSYSNGAAANSAITAASPSDDRWHHVAVLYDQAPNGSVGIYIDGVLEGSMANARGWSWPATQQIGLGRSDEPTFRKYHGYLDDFRMYNRQLTSAEVAEISADDSGVSASDIGTNLQTDMLNVVSSAFIRIPFTVADSNAFSLLTLRIRHNDGFVAWINGQLIASVNAPDPLLWDSAAATTNNSSSVADSITFGSRVLRTGPNILAIQGLNVAAGDPSFLIYPELFGTSVPVESTNGLYFSQPTPGTANTGGAATIGPAISEVTHVPNVPLDNDDLLITALVGPTFGAVSNVTLRYRVMYANEVSVPMTDNGNSGDVTAGDGIFSAIIPASASTNGQMVRYLITAQSLQGVSSKWPLFYNPTNSEQYLGTVVNPDYVTSKLPIFHLFINPTDQAAADAENPGARCAFFYDGEFYDNVRIELRGNTSAGFRKKAHRLEFNRDHRLRHLPEYPRVGDTSLLGESADPAYMRQMFSFWLCEAMGVPSPFDYPVRVQNNGVFYQLAFHSDVMGMEQLERLGYDPNGALYKAAGQIVPGFASTGGFEKKTRLYEDRSDYLALANGINEAQNLATRATNVFDMMDVPNVINYLACARWTTEADDVWANMTLYRDTEGDQLWRIIPFDMNVAWGQLYCGDSLANFNAIIATNDNYKSHPLYGGQTVLPTTGGANWNRVYDSIVRIPGTREMLLRRMRTLLDTFVQPPDTHPLALTMEKRFLSFSNSIYAESILDRLRWGWEANPGSANGPYCYGTNVWMTNHLTDIINQYVVPRRKHWYVTHSITNTARAIGIANANNAGIPLTQPTNAVISVAGVEFNPSSANQQEEFIRLTNGNPYAVDISNWKLDGAVEFIFKGGTVMPSNSVLYVTPNTRAFRNRAVAPRGGMGLYAVGPYQGQLSARGEPLTITDDRGRLVYTNIYTGAPSVAQQFLRVTEIMYNPSPLAGNPMDPQEFEYIELKNISASTTVSLNGVRFINGILFDFTGSSVTSLAPGARVLVVKNLAAFTARYGAASVAGQYSGALDSAGERVQLVDAVNEEILDFSYNNSWYPITDGLGFSLVILDENGEPDLWDQKIGWRPSASPTGAPGQNDPPPPTLAPILVNEVLTHTDPPLVDAVELFNPTASPANIGGWFISDDFSTPKKYRIANNTTIAAGGYLVFDETQFNTPSNAPTSFSFSSQGDEVFIFSGDASTNLTGYFHGYDFGAAETGVTFGRYTNSQTNVHFVAQSARTISPPGANAGPKVGPVVISEIMYHPRDFADGSDNSEDEYIELQNITGSPVELFLASSPTNTWHLRGGADFDLPMNVTLPANGQLLLVNFDAANAALAADFRSRFSVPANVPLFGPFSGKLDNSSDNVRLLKPDTLEGTEAPYILVEEIEYQDEVPWPAAADGTGAALQRRVLTAYANDPTNWTAVAATAGSPSPGGTAPLITIQPANQNAIATLTAMLSVTATGSSPLGYQWKFNGETIPGATSSVLTLVNVQTENIGLYNVTVYNTAGAVESSNAMVNVLLPAVITQPPRNALIYVAPDPLAVPVPTTNFSVTAISSSTIRYQWLFKPVGLTVATNIPGATNATLSITNVQVSNGGDYSVTLTDDVGTISSAPATLYPLVSPKIVLAPLNQTVPINGTVTLSVTASGSPFPFGYEWRRGSFQVASNVANSLANFYTFQARPYPTSETYRVIVRNLANVGINANAQITVTVVADSDNDGIPDAYETAFGVGGQLDPMEDIDDDTMTNLEEYIAGTDPTDPSSYLKVNSLTPDNGATLQFNAASNTTYTVQFTDALGSGWQKLIDVAGQTNAHLEVIVDPNSPTNRFYRLATPKQP
jgi:hypothetical protein